jgi:hypothetical protein
MAYGLLLGVQNKLVHNVILPIFLNEIEQEEHMRVATNMNIVCKDWGLEFVNWRSGRMQRQNNHMHMKTRKKINNPIDDGGRVFVGPHTFYQRFKGK